MTASSHSVIMCWMQELQRVWLITDAWMEQLGHVATSHSSRDKMDDKWSNISRNHCFIKIIRSSPPKRPIMKAFTQWGRGLSRVQESQNCLLWIITQTPSYYISPQREGPRPGNRTPFPARTGLLTIPLQPISVSDPTVCPLRSKDFCQNPMQPV